MTNRTFLIGVAGRSGSGKTELARQIAGSLPGNPPILTLDSYYFSLSHLSTAERSGQNFDHPSALDWALVETHLGRLAAGHAIDEPIYDFASHTRTGESRRIAPGRYVILEGILALHSPRVRDLLDVRIFVDTPDGVCLERRLARDTVERGRTRECVLKQYDTTVRPMAEQFVDPTKAFADLVVRGDRPQAEMLAAVVPMLRGRAAVGAC